MKASEILKLARSLIKIRGWHQGDYVSAPLGSLCIVGAINCASFGDPTNIDSTEADPYITRALGLDVTEDVGSWNDNPKRHINEVIAAFDMAISLAEQDGQ